MWVFNFGRNLLDSEVNDLVQLLSMVKTTLLSLDREEDRIWFLDQKCEFSFKSFYDVLQGAQGRKEGWKQSVINWFPIESLFSVTIDKLRRRVHIIENGCPICLAHKETVNHFLIHSRFATRAWPSVFARFEVLWIMPRTVSELFQQ